MIEIAELTKRYAETVAVDHLTVTARPGQRRRRTVFASENGIVRPGDDE
jgi:ABC-type Na+ transport system ATPase subunit NatA